MKNLNMRSWRGFILLALLFFLFFYNFSIVQKERFLSAGDAVILRLAPVDPRSLMQGDYMVLEFEVERPLREALYQNNSKPRRKGRMVLREHGGENLFARLDDGSSLSAGEKLLAYTVEDYNRIKIGGGSFFFEEGLARFYDRARYALIKVDANGKAIIAGLLDANKKALNKERWNAETRKLRED